MALNHSPSIVRNNLLLNLDFKDVKRFTSTLGTNLVQNPTYSASTWGTFVTIKTTGIDAPDGSTNAVRITSIKKSCSYTLTTNVVTVTMYAHGFTTGQNHYFDFTSGTGVDGYYVVTVINANTFTIPVTAADSSGAVTVYGRTGLRVNCTAFTPNGTDTYTVSFWARLIRASFANGGSAACDLHDAAPSLGYTNQLVQNKWVQIVATGVATATSKSFFDLLSDTWGDIVIDYWGLKIENQTTNSAPMPIKDTVGGYTFNIYKPAYAALSDSSITFTRSTAANTAVTVTNFIANGTTTVTATLPSTSGWANQTAITISGATASTNLNGTWTVTVVNSTTLTFVTDVAVTAGTYTTGLGTMTRSSKWGGLCQTTGTGNLTATNFFYNDHTWEVWFRIDDVTPSYLDSSEGNSVLACYAGWHSGFLYTGSSLYYSFKDGASGYPTMASWTLGTSGTQVVQGQWYQIVVVRRGTTFTPYLNGVQLGTGYTQNPSSLNHGISNLISLGTSYNQYIGCGRWVYYGKNTIGNMKMYNRALSALEIKQNFGALRGRFGI